MVFEFQDDAPLATSTPSRAAWDQGNCLDWVRVFVHYVLMLTSLSVCTWLPALGGALSLKPGDAVGGGKYTIEGVLGAGSNATTYKVCRWVLVPTSAMPAVLRSALHVGCWPGASCLISLRVV
jgi:hypothetical protein